MFPSPSKSIQLNNTVISEVVKQKSGNKKEKQQQSRNKKERC